MQRSDISFFGKQYIKHFSPHSSNQIQVKATFDAITDITHLRVPHFSYIPEDQSKSIRELQQYIVSAGILFGVLGVLSNAPAMIECSIWELTLALTIQMMLTHSQALRELEQDIRPKLNHPDYDPPQHRSIAFCR